MQIEILAKDLYAVAIPNFENVNTFSGFVGTVYNFAIGIVGIAVFIQFIRAGFKYLTAAGNASKTGEAKQIMTNAIVGAILLLSSYLILNVINPDLVANKFNEQLLKNTEEVNTEEVGIIKTERLTGKEAKQKLRNAGIRLLVNEEQLEGIGAYTVETLIKANQKCSNGVRGGCELVLNNVSVGEKGDRLRVEVRPPEAWSDNWLESCCTQNRGTFIDKNNNAYVPEGELNGFSRWNIYIRYNAK